MSMCVEVKFYMKISGSYVVGICSDLPQDKFLETQIVVFTQYLKER